MPWREGFLHFFFLSTVLLNRESIRGIFRSRTISGSPQFPPGYPFLKSLLMVIQNHLDFAGIFLFLVDMLIVDVSKILSATLVSLISKPHFNLPFSLLQSESIYDRFLLRNIRSDLYFFRSSRLLFGF